MGICYGKGVHQEEQDHQAEGGLGGPNSASKHGDTPLPSKSPFRASSFWASASPFRSPFRQHVPAEFATSSPAPSTTTTPLRFLKRPFPPPSPAKHIQAALRRRRSRAKPQKEASVADGEDPEKPPLDRYFGYAKNFTIKYELSDTIGRGHFGHTCRAVIKKGDLKGQLVAVKVIPKAKMTTAIAVEDVKREVKILKALSGHQNLVKFYDACEDNTNVYIVMELCEGGELLDRILSRGGKYAEEDAKAVVVQILSVMSFCHLQGVVHRDLKPENFLFTSNDEDARLKAIDFGLSDFVRPDERLNDIVGSAYYVAPEVLHRSYSIEADIWSIGVITYILLSGNRPFWARTESGIFRSVLKSDPSFDDAPWPQMSEEAKDFVKRLLTKDRHGRMTAAQALTHPWLRGRHQVPLDILVFRLVKSYIRSSAIRRAALKALAKTLSEDQVFYLRTQFSLLEPGKNGMISMENFKHILTKHSTEAMKDSKMFEMIAPMDAVQSRKMDFQEFCAAATSVPQLEGLEKWEEQARKAYQIFEKEGNRVVLIEDLARELGIPASVPAHVVLHDWVRNTDGKLSFFGFTNVLRGMPPRSKPQPTR